MGEKVIGFPPPRFWAENKGFSGLYFPYCKRIFLFLKILFFFLNFFYNFKFLGN